MSSSSYKNLFMRRPISIIIPQSFFQLEYLVTEKSKIGFLGDLILVLPVIRIYHRCLVLYMRACGHDLLDRSRSEEHDCIVATS